MINYSKRLAPLSTGIFNQLLSFKEEQIKQGKDIIDLSIGSPDLTPPSFVIEELSRDVLNKELYGYAINSTLSFKEAVVSYYNRKFQVTVTSDDVLQLVGSQDGLAHLALAYLDPGDVVIVPDPGYPIYSASVHVAGGELYSLPLLEENNFLPSLEDIPEEISNRAKMLIVGYPGNPIPTIANESFLKKLIEFGKKNNILIIHDFAYCELLFDDRKPLSILSLPNAREIALEFNSLSKSFNLAGARIGFIVGDQQLLAPLALLKSHFDYGVFLPIQMAATKALNEGDAFLEAQRKVYQSRRNAFITELNNNGWQVKSPEGGMFIWAKTPQGYTSFEFTLAAIKHGVVVTPGDAFGPHGEGYVRVALVQYEERLIEAAKRLINIRR
ncbi:LL-diaminopimelate aminotransferase [Anaerobacillus isosaccharinicus]|uniref:Aminotransferase n=1 Tax=Anaerobacillus isosaccharinicus TaxID=1532552 RepID=A0A1S2MDZ4_9BACI|nr:LL-diaminopimelate aminotransferase [Anaerobacillus isosaccharinicus]MBA5584936.1 LL-diaminopimelate aminotransferase [Anaerobacillus isosaccharinicus]QOY36707.1 LL-diaminopimelate aminotransferase [Anaerobacillus isosaccharinicus]